MGGYGGECRDRILGSASGRESIANLHIMLVDPHSFSPVKIDNNAISVFE
jgi:hypothetical protein